MSVACVGDPLYVLVVCFASFVDFSTGVTLSIRTLFSMPFSSMNTVCKCTSFTLYVPRVLRMSLL